MPEVVSCPKCQRKSRVPDGLVGKMVKCPGCAEVFTATIGGPPPARKEPPARKKADEDEGGTYDVLGEKKRRRRDDDDDDDRVSDQPRGRRRDDEDEDDRPRTSRRRDDEDDDGRVTTRRRRLTRDDEDDDEDDDDSPRRSLAPPADWPRVRVGFSLLLASVLTQVGIFLFTCFGAGCLGGMQGARGPNAPPPAVGDQAPGVAVVLGIAVGVGLIAWLLKVLGSVMCLPSPSTYSAKTLATVGLGLIGIEAIMTVLHTIVNMAINGPGGLIGHGRNPFLDGGGLDAKMIVMLVLQLIAGAFWIGWVFVIGLYIRSIGLSLNNYSLAGTAKGWLITVGLTVTLGVVAMVVIVATVGLAGAPFINQMQAMQAGKPQAPGLAGGAMAGGLVVGLGMFCLVLILWLAVVIWYIVMLIQARGAIGLRRARY